MYKLNTVIIALIGNILFTLSTYTMDPASRLLLNYLVNPSNSSPQFLACAVLEAIVDKQKEPMVEYMCNLCGKTIKINQSAHDLFREIHLKVNHQDLHAQITNQFYISELPKINISSMPTYCIEDKILHKKCELCNQDITGKTNKTSLISAMKRHLKQDHKVDPTKIPHLLLFNVDYTSQEFTSLP